MKFVNCLIVLMMMMMVVPCSASLSSDHTHDIPKDFRVSCKTYGPRNEHSTTNFIWDAKVKKMIITGDVIGDDNNRLSEGTGWGAERSIKHASEFSKGGIPLPGGGNTPDVKTLYMTFRTDHEGYSTHGGGHIGIRAFVFYIRDGVPGYVSTTDAQIDEGIFIPGRRTGLGDCDYSGIYAKP